LTLAINTVVLAETGLKSDEATLDLGRLSFLL